MSGLRFVQARFTRAGIIVGMVYPAAATWLWFVALAGRPSMQIVYGASKVTQFAWPLICLLAARGIFSGKRPTDEGAGREWAPRDVRGSLLRGVLFGAAVGILILGAWFGWLRGSAFLGDGAAGVRGKVEQLGMATPGRFLILSLFYSVVHSGLEEYYWRWFVFGGLRQTLSPRMALVLSSLAFTAHHVIVLGVCFGRAWWMTLLASTAVAVGGAAWAAIYDRSRSLLGPWLSHFIVDAFLMIIGYDMIWPIG